MLTGLFILLSVVSCERAGNDTDPKEETNALTVSRETIVFPEAGGISSFDILTDADSWNITFASEANWIDISQDSGTTGTTAIQVNAERNTVTGGRSASIIIKAGNAPDITITITQSGALYPGYNTNPSDPDNTGMGSTATQIANKISMGWNCGNTLEAIGGETAWGNPQITAELIQLVKQSGFDAIRLPCSWNQYTDQETAEIQSDWLNRVKEVVQHCIDQEMYVILNIHWDGGWLENNCTPDKQEENIAKQRALWEQIATHLRDFDEHLLFAGSNEPNVENSTQMEVLMSYHQTFVDAVRSTGGRNSYRVLVVQGPSTDIEKTNNLFLPLPTDEIADRMMAEVHYYTPYQFCLMTEDATWGNMFYYWGADYHSETDSERNATWGEESTADELMGLMNAKFVMHGIPVILGEYAVGRRMSLSGDALDLHLASRAYYLKYVTKQAKANGIIPFYWDAGGMGDNGSGLFNRNNLTVFDQQALDALIEGATE
jgi:aryl-phospho-beta-D-glucosidase BglC (GH1 family)